MSISDINDMSLTKRMYLMEQLWDSFKQNEDELASPIWHEEILNKRKELYDNGKLKILSLDELKAVFDK